MDHLAAALVARKREELESVRPGLEPAGHPGLDPECIERRELRDLVVELDLPEADADSIRPANFSIGSAPRRREEARQARGEPRVALDLERPAREQGGRVRVAGSHEQELGSRHGDA